FVRMALSARSEVEPQPDHGIATHLHPVYVQAARAVTGFALNVREFRDFREVGDHLFPITRFQRVGEGPAMLRREVIETEIRCLGPCIEAGRAELEIFDAEVLAHLPINRALEE